MRLFRLFPVLFLTIVMSATVLPLGVPTSACRWLSLLPFLGTSLAPAHKQCAPWIWPLQPIAVCTVLVPCLMDVARARHRGAASVAWVRRAGWLMLALAAASEVRCVGL